MYETEPLAEVLSEIVRHLATEHPEILIARQGTYPGDDPFMAPIAYPPEDRVDVALKLAAAHPELVIARHVTSACSRPHRAPITYSPEAPSAPAGYRCELCPGLVFYPVEPTYGHPARNAYLLRITPALREKVLGLTPKQAAIVIEDWDRRRGTQGNAELDEVLRRQGRATKRAGRPEVEARIARCQDYLLEAWERLGTQDEAIWELIRLANTDPSRHQRIVGRRYPMAYSTYHQYLGKKDLSERRAEVQARIRAR